MIFESSSLEKAISFKAFAVFMVSFREWTKISIWYFPALSITFKLNSPFKNFQKLKKNFFIKNFVH